MGIIAHDRVQNGQEVSAEARRMPLHGVTLKQSDAPLTEYLSPDNLSILRADGSYEEIAATLKIRWVRYEVGLAERARPSWNYGLVFYGRKNPPVQTRPSPFDFV